MFWIWTPGPRNPSAAYLQALLLLCQAGLLAEFRRKRRLSLVPLNRRERPLTQGFYVDL